MIAIYKITNKLNRKLYVGQTKQPVEKRFLQHSKADSPLGNAMQDCGLENFTIEVIEECETKAQADERERFWIKVLKCKYPNGYNQTDGGAGATGYTSVRKRHRENALHQSRPLELTLVDSIRRIAAYRGYTLVKLDEEFSRRFGGKYAKQDFSKKLKNGKVRYDELKQLGDILGFKIKLELSEQAAQ